MKKTVLVLLAMVMLGGCTPKAYWKADTPYKQAKMDYERCYAKAWDLFKEEKLAWDDEAKQYIDKCMREKGYVLKEKEEAYPSSAPLGTLSK